MVGGRKALILIELKPKLKLLIHVGAITVPTTSSSSSTLGHSQCRSRVSGPHAMPATSSSGWGTRRARSLLLLLRMGHTPCRQPPPPPPAGALTLPTASSSCQLKLKLVLKPVLKHKLGLKLRLQLNLNLNLNVIIKLKRKLRDKHLIHTRALSNSSSTWTASRRGGNVLQVGRHRGVRLQVGRHRGVGLQVARHRGVRFQAGRHRGVRLQVGRHHGVRLQVGRHHGVAACQAVQHRGVAGGREEAVRKEFRSTAAAWGTPVAGAGCGAGHAGGRCRLVAAELEGVDACGARCVPTVSCAMLIARGWESPLKIPR